MSGFESFGAWTKYARGVTCASCLGVALEVGRAEQAAGVIVSRLG